mmetsp:Transcript_130850/g.279957  ORF Transcript_130850/g.279957 Transcript_130850/m.279957 type:complete len:472 (+) Transcript_130850:91-1506(+)
MQDLPPGPPLGADGRQLVAPGPGGFFTLVYPDCRCSDAQVVEQLTVDDAGGTFTWVRSSDAPAERPPDNSAVASSAAPGTTVGGMFYSADIAGVQFTTKRGDPCKEFLTESDVQLMEQRALNRWFSERATEVFHVFLLVANPLSMLLLLSIIQTGCLWTVFPRDENGRYLMGQAAHEPGLYASTVLAAVNVVATVAVGTWLGLLGEGRRRLPKAIYSRWPNQKLMNTLLLGLFLAWCVFVLILCPFAKVRSTQEECLSSNSEGGRRRLLALESVAVGADADAVGGTRVIGMSAGGGRRLDSHCYALDGDNVTQVCGTAGCPCTVVKDLMCSDAPAPPIEVCQVLERPLCATSVSGIRTSGMHGLLLVAASGASVFSFLILFDVILSAIAMFLVWFPELDTKVRNVAPPVGDLLYHRFTVEFTVPDVNRLVFVLSGAEDPERVASLLLRGRPKVHFKGVEEEELHGTTVLNV